MFSLDTLLMVSNAHISCLYLKAKHKRIIDYEEEQLKEIFKRFERDIAMIEERVKGVWAEQAKIDIDRLIGENYRYHYRDIRVFPEVDHSDRIVLKEGRPEYMYAINMLKVCYNYVKCLT